MGKKIIAIVGSYRRQGAIDTAVDTLLEAAAEHGAETEKFFLTDLHMEFCRNCRVCTQPGGTARGECPMEDDLQDLFDRLDKADVIVLAAPVNYWNVTAVFRQFLERLLPYAYWPWGAFTPKWRLRSHERDAILISSAAMPGFLIPVATGAPRALRTAARSLGAKPIGHLWMGQIATKPQPRLAPSLLRRARMLGERIA